MKNKFFKGCYVCFLVVLASIIILIGMLGALGHFLLFGRQRQNSDILIK